MKVRSASHAGSWYENDRQKLDRQLATWLAAVDASQVPLAPASVIDGDAASTSRNPLEMPISGLKAVIAPHAGYSYSGPAAAWAYKCIDPEAYDRVVILGPSHHVYLDGCALSGCDLYETPIGNLTLDSDTLAELRATGKFADDMDRSTDEDEHSIEMHLPYIRKVFEGRQDIQIVPILVGSISTGKEAAFGQLLAPYLADERTLFVVSSDFCHWGSRFSYTHYRASPLDRARSLSARDKLSIADVPIHASIRALDGEAIAKLTYPPSLPQPDARRFSGRNGTPAQAMPSSTQPRTAKEAQEEFAAYLRETKNTICGRHPIGVLLGALAALESQGTSSQLSFTRYEQSSACEAPRDSSVSYASAYVRFT